MNENWLYKQLSNSLLSMKIKIQMGRGHPLALCYTQYCS